MAEVLYWILTFFFLLTLLCLLGYQLILLVDLEFDYINPYDSTSRINQVILPEFIIQGIFSFINLVAGHWFIFLISLPCLYYDVTMYVKREHLTDVTEIYNKLNWEKNKRLYKVANLVMVFVISILGMEPYRRGSLIAGLPSMPTVTVTINYRLRHSIFLLANQFCKVNSMARTTVRAIRDEPSSLERGHVTVYIGALARKRENRA